MSTPNCAEAETENTWESLDERVQRTVISLRDFARGQDKDFQYVLSLNPTDLAGFLKEFYLALRESSDDDAKAASQLNQVRSDLQQYFLKMANVDISNGNEFPECNAIVDSSLTKDVPKNGIVKKHSRQRTLTFETSELRQIYLSDAMNLDQPETLQNKVFFDVCMYICNRGKDFLRLMTKSDFEVSTDQNGLRYVWLKYDSKFSFQEVAGGMTCDGKSGTQIGGRMYERPGDPKCPVLSYTSYSIHLHPMSDAFWQRPKRNVLPTDFVWYDNICIGNTTLNKLMNRITQAAGLQDSYAINAIKSSYIPIIESICRSALFGSQQFRRILLMKQQTCPDLQMQHVRKRHSEGSLSIASVLRENPHLRLGHSESQLPHFMTQNSTDSDQMRSSSVSPVHREGRWEAGDSPHRMYRKTPPDSSESGYMIYRSPASDMPSGGYGQNYNRETSHDSPQEQTEPARQTAPSYAAPRNDDQNTSTTTANILHAKQKCLDIVHSLEVRDIKSFINWMKTFEAKHGPAGLTVTCQPVGSGDVEQKNMQAEQNGTPYNSEGVKLEQGKFRKFEAHRQNSLKEKERVDFEAKRLEFDCIGEMYCCTSDISPLKITIPTQDTMLLTGIPHCSQILIHDKKDVKNQSTEQSHSPLQSNIFMSNQSFNLDQIESFEMKSSDFKNEASASQDSARMNFKEEKSIPMKKRLVLDQSESCPGQSYSQSAMSPPQSYNQSGLSPPVYASHSSPQRFGPQSSYVQAQNQGSGQGPQQGPAQGPPRIPKYRERFPDGWGYVPLQKRQKFGLMSRQNNKEEPLDLIKQN